MDRDKLYNRSEEYVKAILDTLSQDKNSVANKVDDEVFNLLCSVFVDAYQECEYKHKWHKVTEDPKSFPKNDHNTIILSDDLQEVGYFPRIEGWLNAGGESVNVKYWYEIPRIVKE
jgi:hypothetical protein